VVELREEVTQARATAVMAEAHAAQAEEMAHERDVLLDTAHGVADEAA
jgi:hypothetical protein